MNALDSIENQMGSTGDPSSDPEAYAVLTSYTPADVMVTSFHSWQGVADPSSPFASELGNRLHFGVDIRGDGTVQFALNDLTFAITSADGVLDYSGDFVGLNYTGTTRYGIDWGADNARGGGDDTYYTSGNGTTLVDEIVYVGVGNAYWPGEPGSDPANGRSNQQVLDDMAAYIQANAGVITGSYSIRGSDDNTYSALVEVTPVPEPGTVLLLGLGLVGVAAARRRRARGHA